MTQNPVESHTAPYSTSYILPFPDGPQSHTPLLQPCLWAVAFPQPIQSDLGGERKPRMGWQGHEPPPRELPRELMLLLAFSHFYLEATFALRILGAAELLLFALCGGACRDLQTLMPTSAYTAFIPLQHRTKPRPTAVCCVRGVPPSVSDSLPALIASAIF